MERISGGMMESIKAALISFLRCRVRTSGGALHQDGTTSSGSIALV